MEVAAHDELHGGCSELAVTIAGWGAASNNDRSLMRSQEAAQQRVSHGRGGKCFGGAVGIVFLMGRS